MMCKRCNDTGLIKNQEPDIFGSRNIFAVPYKYCSCDIGKKLKLLK